MSETRPTADDLKRLDDKARQLRSELCATEEDLKLATLAFWGCKIGDPVRETGRGKPRSGEVVSVGSASGGARTKPWVSVRLHKQDGTLGERIVNFYRDWERVEDAASDAA